MESALTPALSHPMGEGVIQCPDCFRVQVGPERWSGAGRPRVAGAALAECGQCRLAREARLRRKERGRRR